MSNLSRAKLLFAIIGIGIWLYGVRMADRRLQWLGVGVVLVAFILRFVPRGKPPEAR